MTRIPLYDVFCMMCARRQQPDARRCQDCGSPNLYREETGSMYVPTPTPLEDLPDELFRRRRGRPRKVVS